MSMYITYSRINRFIEKGDDDYLRFENEKFVTKGVNSSVSLLLQFFMWKCISDMKGPKDYLQIFNCSEFEGKQKIEHIQEEPEYKMEYLILTDTPVFIGKIFVIDDETHSTMQLSEEY